MSWFTQLIGLPHSPPTPPAELGKDQNPGEAAEGTVLHIIEVAVERRVRLHPDIPLRELYNTVKEFDVVRNTGRDVCKLYLDDCIKHYRLPQVGSHGGQSDVTSTAPSDGGSHAPSKTDSQTPPTTAAEPSTLGLNDSTNPIEIILQPNDVPNIVVSTEREGDKSYISQSIVDRLELVPNERRKVLIELRWRTEDGARGRSYRIPNCSFKIKDGLETDLAIGRQVREQLKNKAASTEDSYDCESSSENEGPRNGRQKPDPQNVETLSHNGSSVSSSGGKATPKDLLDTFNRIMDMNGGSRAAGDTSGQGHRQDHRDVSHPPVARRSRQGTVP